MRLSLRCLCASLLVLCAAESALAEPFDHFHLLAADPAKAVAWYKANLGARDGDTPDRVVIGRTIFAFIKTDNPPPSAGTAVDHFGFSVPDVDAAMTKMQAAGAKVLTPARDVPGLFKLGFIEDPFGIKIEILQDAETPGVHHIHLLVPDPEASLAFYARHFGGERAQLIDHRVDGVLQLEDLALHVHGDLLRQVAARHGGGHLGDVAHLRREVARHRVDRVGEILPGPGHALHVGLAAELSFRADLLRDARIDAILHCAAKSIVSDSVEHPERYYRDNLIGSLNLLDAAMAAGIFPDRGTPKSTT